MKKLITILVLALCSFTLVAQNSNEVTLKFLGIPIDGNKSQMIELIKAKGFTFNSYRNCLQGQFNGKNIDVYVVDNHGIVYRVFVAFPKIDEYEIRSEFNHLLSQFTRNDKYVPIKECEAIDQKEDISYEMSVHNKQYGASFSYISPDIFTPEQTAKIHGFFDNYATMSEEETQQYLESMAASFSPDLANASPDDIMLAMNRVASLLSGNVWFKIFREGVDYQIGLYYDNLKNSPNGEDL